MTEPHTPHPTPTPYGSASLGQGLPVHGAVPQPWGPPTQPPTRKSRTGLAVLLVLVTLVGAACVFGTTYALTDPRQPVVDPTLVAASASKRPTASPKPSAKPSSSATTAPTLPSDKKPELRAGVAPKVFAEKFSGGKYVMKFGGWPFAFETHGDFGCVGGKLEELPDAKAWACVNEKTRTGQKISIMLRRCEPTCTATVISAMNKAWLSDADSAKKHGDRTFYSEVAKDDEGRYAVDLSHFIAEKAGGPLQWQVGVYTYSPPDLADDVKMTLNSVLYQAG